MTTNYLSLAELLGVNIRTCGNLGLVADSAAHVVSHQDLTEVETAKLNIILGYASAKTGKHAVAAHHYMWAFNVGHTNGQDVQLVVTAGIGVILALMNQKEYQRARHVMRQVEAAVDEASRATVVERVLLDQMLEQITWRLAEVP